MEMWELGCTGEFGCDCLEKRKAEARRLGVRKFFPHGTRQRYRQELKRGKACAACTRANASYSKDLRERKVNGAA